MRGKFIVLEGIDGSGTSTQTKLLSDKLSGLGIPVHPTHEPSSGPVGQLIRSILTDRVRFSSDMEKLDNLMKHMFIADRIDHVNNEVDGIQHILDSGTTVICTRYFYSSLAYNSGDSYEETKQLNSQFPLPDLVIYIDTPVEVSLDRIYSRAIKDSYETETKLIQVKNAYERVWSDYPENLIRVDGEDDIDEISESIFDKVSSLYN